jgi:hypothetical protein
MIMRRYSRVFLVTIVLSLGVALFTSKEVLRAQDANRPAIPPQPRTINLTQEQRFIIKENIKDLRLSKRRETRRRRSGIRSRRTLSFTPYRRKRQLRCHKHGPICFS